jgi:hypothetical protein
MPSERKSRVPLSNKDGRSKSEQVEAAPGRRRLLAGAAAGLAIGAGAVAVGAVAAPGSASAATGGPSITIAPSGDTTGATDAKAINAALAAGTAVILEPGGQYYLNVPITPKTGSRIDGNFWWSASDQDYYSAGAGASGGTLLTMVSGFSGAAAILMENTTSDQYYGFTIEGNENSSGTIYGILVDGAWGACFLRGVTIHRPPSDCIRFVTDTTSGKIPDDWQITSCKFTGSRNGYGVYCSELADSWFEACESSENDLDNWYFNYGVNTRLVDCKGENSYAGAGFHLAGIAASEAIWLTGCSTHLNSTDGFVFDNAGGGGGQGLYHLTGCIAQNDGQNNNGLADPPPYAGFRANGCLSAVTASGCAVVGGSSGPQYGAIAQNASYGLAFTGSTLTGTTAATLDDGTNTNALFYQYGPWQQPATGGGTLTKYLAPAVATLTYASTIVVNAALGNAFNLTLTASTGTLENPTNPVDGQIIRFRVKQGSGGSFTLSYGTAYGFGAAGKPTLSKTAGDTDILGFEYVAGISKWCFLGAGLGY